MQYYGMESAQNGYRGGGLWLVIHFPSKIYSHGMVVSHDMNRFYTFDDGYT